MQAKKQRSGHNDFIKLYQQKLQVHKRDDAKQWQVILPFNNPFIQRQFQVLDQKFRLAGRRTFEKMVDIDKFYKAANLNYDFRLKKPEVPEQILITSINGRHLLDGWEQLRTKFGILQGVYDFGLLNGSWGTGRASMTRFQHPDWLLLIGEDETYQLGSFRVPNEVIKSAIDLKRIAQSKP